ncbi:MAG: PAS domain-containing protein [Halobacteria archaeon]
MVKRNIQPRIIYVGTDDVLATYLNQEQIHMDRVLSSESCLEKYSMDFYDCVVADPVQPGMGSVELYNELSETYGYTDFILLDGDNKPLEVKNYQGINVVSCDNPDNIRSEIDDLMNKRLLGKDKDIGDFNSNKNIGSDETDEQLIKSCMFKKSPIGITVSNPCLKDNPLIYVNKSFERLTGYRKSEIIGMNCRFLQGEGTSRNNVNKIREAIDAGEKVAVELLNYRKNGEKFWNHVEINPIYDDDGKLRFYIGYQMDVTELKRAEKKSREKTNQLEAKSELLSSKINRHGRVLKLVSELTTKKSTPDGLKKGIRRHLKDIDAYSLVRFIHPRLSRVGYAAENTDEKKNNSSNQSGLHDMINNSVQTGKIKVTTNSYLLNKESLGDLTTEKKPADTDNSGKNGGESLGHNHKTQGYRNVNSAAAVPLVYNETPYGVLIVCSEDTEFFDRYEKNLLKNVGKTLAGVLHDLNQRAKTSQGNNFNIELTLEYVDDFYVKLSTSLDCRIEFKLGYGDFNEEIYFELENAEKPDILGWMEEHGYDFSMTELKSGGDRKLIHLKANSPLLRDFEGIACSIENIIINRGIVEVEMTAKNEDRAKNLIRIIEKRYPTVDLKSFKENSGDKKSGTRKLNELLTEKQKEAVEKCYLSGYYKSPRETTGKEIAKSMGISKVTFHQHLRAAERKIIERIFEKGDPSVGTLRKPYK